MNKDSEDSCETLRVLIADDHLVVRLGVRSILDRDENIAIVGEATNGEEAVRRYFELRPHVVLMDLRMPVKNGLDALKEILGHDAAARILMLSTYDGDEDIRHALELGAAGYLLKQDAGEDMIDALAAVTRGERWLSSAAQRQIDASDSKESVTAREREILSLLARGDANKQIGDQLQITENTVKSHLKSILGKLQARSRTEAVTAAIRRGIIQAP